MKILMASIVTLIFRFDVNGQENKDRPKQQQENKTGANDNRNETEKDMLCGKEEWWCIERNQCLPKKEGCCVWEEVWCPTTLSCLPQAQAEHCCKEGERTVWCGDEDSSRICLAKGECCSNQTWCQKKEICSPNNEDCSTSEVETLTKKKETVRIVLISGGVSILLVLSAFLIAGAVKRKRNLDRTNPVRESLESNPNYGKDTDYEEEHVDTDIVDYNDYYCDDNT